MTNRRPHPARAALERANRKISSTIRATCDVDYAHGWCGPDWQRAVALEAELRAQPAFVALRAAAEVAPLYA